MPLDDRPARLDAAADPIPASVERGPVARLHYRNALDVDPALAAVVVDTPATPVEWSALIAETHATLLDPSGLSPLPRPSPLGRSVMDALTSSDAWPTLADAARSHPLVAREAVTSLAGVVLDALKRSGAKPATDTRASLADLDAARAALERARAAERAATTPAERRDALRDSIAAREAVERAEAAVAADDGIAARTGAVLDDAGEAIAEIARHAEEQTAAAHAFSAALGSAQGVGGVRAVPDDIVKALTPQVVAMLKMVGALRKALSKGRAGRHVRGREGMIGPAGVGLDAVADLTPTSLASLGGHLGKHHAALTRLALVEGCAAGVAKGGGIARNGDVVVVVDKSGSMMGAREVWAGALALAVVLEARADGRTVGVVTYDGSVRFAVVVDSLATLSAAVVALTTSSGGDNNERAALQAAGRLLKAMPHGGDPADVLMVTDGQWRASNLTGAGIERARLRGVFIGGHAPEGAGFASTWEVRGNPSTDGADGVLAVEIASVVV